LFLRFSRKFFSCHACVYLNYLIRNLCDRMRVTFVGGEDGFFCSFDEYDISPLISAHTFECF